MFEFYPSLYIRILLMTYLSYLFGASIEIPKLHLSTLSQMLSFSFSLLILLLCLFTPLLPIWRWRDVKKPDGRQRYFLELFRGLKHSNYALGFPLFFLMRRLVSVAIVSGLTFMNVFMKAMMFLFTQLVFMGLTIDIKYFKEHKLNFASVVNDVVLGFMAVVLSYFNTTADWNVTVTN